MSARPDRDSLCDVDEELGGAAAWQPPVGATVLERARAALTLSAAPAALPCRNAERSQARVETP